MSRLFSWSSFLSAIVLSMSVNAHEMTRWPSDTEHHYTNSRGKIWVKVTNQYLEPVDFEIEVDYLDPVNVLSKGPAPLDHWRSDISEEKDVDIFTLQPGESEIVAIQLRYDDSAYYVCSRGYLSDNWNSRVCIRAIYR